MKGVDCMKIDKKLIDNIKINAKKYTPEIIDGNICKTQVKVWIDISKSYFDDISEKQRERITKLIQEKEDQDN